MSALSNAAIEALPAELAWKIGEELDLMSLRALRLTSRWLNKQYTRPFAEHHLDSAKFEMSQAGMADLLALSQNEELNLWVRHLRLIVPMYCELPTDGLVWHSNTRLKEWVRKRRSEQRALTADSIGIDLSSVLEGLYGVECIELDAIVRCRPGVTMSLHLLPDIDDQPIKHQSRKYYDGLMWAIAAARPRWLRSLAIYKDVPQCGIVTDGLIRFLSKMIAGGIDGHFEQVLRQVTEFSISLSSPRKPLKDGQRRGPSGNVFFVPTWPRESPDTLLRLLRFMPRLRTIDLRLERTHTNTRNHEFLPALLSKLVAPDLARLSLVGFATMPRAIESIPDRFPKLHCLVLWCISTATGNWREPVRRLTARAPALAGRGFNWTVERDMCVLYSKTPDEEWDE